MTDVVTIGVPVYKRLGFLANVLRSIGEQDYPAIEVIVSDNGLNGEELTETNVLGAIVGHDHHHQAAL